MSKCIVFFTIITVFCLSFILLAACTGEVVDSPVTPTAVATASATRARLPTHTPSTHTRTHTPAPTPTFRPLVEYTVEPGDTLSDIATTYDVPMAVIQLQNEMGDSVVVQVGQTLSIPPRNSWGALSSLPVNWEGATRYWIVHVVKAGETLVGIAQAFGLPAAEIKAVNGLADADMIRVGQELVIPLDAPAVARAPTLTPTPPPPPTTAPTPNPPTASPVVFAPDPTTAAPTLAPTGAPVAPPPANVADWPHEIVRLINHARAQYGLLPLAYNETLAQVAQAHTNDCLQRGWGGHYGSDGSNIKTRMQRAGYDPVRWSECWAQTQSPQGAMDVWMDEVPPNDPHRRTILNPALEEIGVGVGQPDWGFYFFADFGTSRN